MHPFRSLLIFAAFTLLGSALLGPALYKLAHAVAPGSWITEHPFHRYMNRAFMMLAVIGIWPLLKGLGATSWRDVGIVADGGQGKIIDWRRLMTGFMTGFVSLGCITILIVAAHQRSHSFDFTAPQFIGKLFGAIATAVVVAALEELLFRGAIFGAFRRVWDWRFALMLSSAIYSITHFMQDDRTTTTVTWLSGFEFLPKLMRNFCDAQMMIPGFLNLTLIGIFLGLAYQRTGNLYFSIGLHAGWVLTLKLFGLLTVPAAVANTAFWGTGKMVDSWLIFIILCVAWVVVLFVKPAKTTSNTA